MLAVLVVAWLMLAAVPFAWWLASRRRTDVWRALRASMRSVLEQTSLAEVAAGALPEHVARMAGDYIGQEAQRGHSDN